MIPPVVRPIMAKKALPSYLKNAKADMPVFYDETKASSYENANITVAASGGYFSQKLYFMSDDDIFVTIDPNSTYINPNTEYNKGYAEVLYDEYQNGDDDSLKNLTKEEIEERLNKLVEAMRYSILIPSEQDYDYAIIDPHKKEDTVFGGLLDNDIDRYYDYFIKESDHQYYERLYGEYTGVPKYYDNPRTSDSALEIHGDDSSANAFNARHKDGVYEINWEKSETEGHLEIATENSIALEDFNKDNKPFRIPVYRNQPQEIVLSIYIEGWDLESINHTKGAKFDSNIRFKIEREQ